MNYYHLLKYVVKSSPRTRLLGVITMHLLHARYLFLSVDPSNGCNYRCRMCYRSSDLKPIGRHTLSEDDIDNIIRAFGSETLRLQIGCAMEPSIAYDQSLHLLKKAKKANIRFISMCTNGVLLTREKLEELASEGLDELIISCHGIHKETYEFFMRGKYDKFLQLLDNLCEVKSAYPQMKLRINYTMNADNTLELKDFFSVFSKVKPDTLQLRPIQDIGSQDYTNYDLTPVKEMYDSVIKPLAVRCREMGIQIILPELNNIETLESNDRINALEDIFQKNTQVYISPDKCYSEDFDLSKDTYRSYCSSHGKTINLLKSLFISGKQSEERLHSSTTALKYKL